MKMAPLPGSRAQASQPAIPAHPFTRRRFISACAACTACCAARLLDGRPVLGSEPSGKKPRIRLVFCETPNDQPIWPNVGYDFEARRKQLLDLLHNGCAELEFLPARLMNDPKQADAVLAADGEVDGYVLFLQGLGWSNDIEKLSATGKPTLVVDNLFGGSGMLLSHLPKMMSAGKPVDWVSSSRDRDIVASVRQFKGLAKGVTGPDTATGFRMTRRRNTPPVLNWACKKDPVEAVDMEKALQQLRHTRILVVGGGRGGDEFRKASKEVTGVEFVPIEFEELAGAHAQAERKAAAVFAEEWSKKARKISGVSAAEMENCGAMYVGMKQLLEKHSARGITINCLGGFYGGHLKAYPCLGFSHFNNELLVGGCEADQMSALTMAVVTTLTGRPGFISDPVIDTSKNAIIYAHCVAMTKPFGPGGKPNPYDILTHSEDRKGASVRSLLPSGYLTTTLEINPTTRQVLIHQAKALDNNPSDMACRTKLEAAVKGDLEKLTEHWSMGWHRVTFYGDLAPHMEELCQRLKLRLVQEA